MVPAEQAGDLLKLLAHATPVSRSYDAGKYRYKRERGNDYYTFKMHVVSLEDFAEMMLND
jgi:hypothetical protein